MGYHHGGTENTEKNEVKTAGGGEWTINEYWIYVLVDAALIRFVWRGRLPWHTRN
jgi:hypothetical protein